jgi:di/tricarboxylate transporter
MLNFDQIVALAILALTLVLFWTERLRAELVALFGMVLLMVFGLVTPEQGVAGFSHPATITVLALFILTAGVSRTGLIAALGHWMGKKTAGSQVRFLLILMVLAVPASAFLNNTAIVAILLPLTLSVAAHSKVSPSKVLMPLSQMAMLAGTVTLIGTSPNLLASGLVLERTGTAFTLFQFTKIGLVVLATGLLYILLIGRHLIPERIPAGQTGERLLLQQFAAEVRVKPNSPLVGKAASEHERFRPGRLEILALLRNGKAIAPATLLEPGDIIAIRAPRESLTRMEKEAGVEILSGVDASDIEAGQGHIAEVIVAPASSIVRRAVTEGWFARTFGVKVLGIRSSPKPAFGFGFTTRLAYGDSLLIVASEESIERIRQDPDFIVASEERSERLQPRKALLALGIMGAVIAVATMGVTSILVAALAGAVAMVLVRVLQPDDLWTSVRWDVIFLLAGMIPMGQALVNTGLADMTGSWVANVSTNLPPIGIIGIFYAASMLLTMFISNAGTVILMVPIAFSTAEALTMSPTALVVAIMFAASNEFVTPVGYQTNLMVYGPGGYRFSDYARAGALLAVILAIVTSAAIVHWIPM